MVTKTKKKIVKKKVIKKKVVKKKVVKKKVVKKKAIKKKKSISNKNKPYEKTPSAVEFDERRKHRRIRLSPYLIEPVQIRIPDVKGNQSVPAIIADLSAKGMAMLTYVNIPIGTTITIDFNLIGLKVGNVQGKVYRVRTHYKTYVVVINFNKIQKAIQTQIEHIAMDYEDCEILWKRGDVNFCKKSCEYYPFCSKSIKKV